MQNQKHTISSKNQIGGVTAHTVNTSQIKTVASPNKNKKALKIIGLVIAFISALVGILTYLGINPFVN